MDKCTVGHNQEVKLNIDAKFVANIVIKRPTTIHIGDIIETQHEFFVVNSIKEVNKTLELNVSTVELIKAEEIEEE